MSLTQALKLGLGVALIGGLIAGLYNIVFTTFIEPDFAEQIVEQQRMTLNQDYPNLTQEQVEQSLEMTRKIYATLDIYGILRYS